MASDHDILIRLDEKMDNVLSNFENLPCAEQALKLDTMVTRSWFKWVVGMVILAVIALAGLGSANKMSLTQIETKQEMVIKKLDNAVRAEDSAISNRKEIEDSAHKHRNAIHKEDMDQEDR